MQVCKSGWLVNVTTGMILFYIATQIEWSLQVREPAVVCLCDELTRARMSVWLRLTSSPGRLLTFDHLAGWLAIAVVGYAAAAARFLFLRRPLPPAALRLSLLTAPSQLCCPLPQTGVVLVRALVGYAELASPALARSPTATGLPDWLQLPVNGLFLSC